MEKGWALMKELHWGDLRERLRVDWRVHLMATHSETKRGRKKAKLTEPYWVRLKEAEKEPELVLERERTREVSWVLQKALETVVLWEILKAPEWELKWVNWRVPAKVMQLAFV